jgi:hypothetical protein
MGSAAARGFARWGRGGEVLLGHNRELLEQGFERWERPREVGMIAGRMPLGLGAVLGHFEGEHDGTVAVEETRCPVWPITAWSKPVILGLLFSPDVALQRTGRFPAPRTVRWGRERLIGRRTEFRSSG